MGEYQYEKDVGWENIGVKKLSRLEIVGVDKSYGEKISGGYMTGGKMSSEKISVYCVP